MTQRGFIVTLGCILKRWEANKRKVEQNRIGTLPGNKVEADDFDVFDQWMSRQRKFIRDYLGAEEYDELKGVRRFLKQETDVPQIHLHFGIWSSLTQKDSKTTLEHFSSLMNEYHEARLKSLSVEGRCPVNEYADRLEKEQMIIRQINRTKESYHLSMAAFQRLKNRDGQRWDSEYETYQQKKLIHQTKIARKTYEDILRYEAGKTRASLMKVTHSLEKLIVLEEEKRLTQLLTIIDEYFNLLFRSIDVDPKRKEQTRQLSRQLKGIMKQVPNMVKTWIQNHRRSVEFPEFQEPSETGNSEGHKQLIRVLGEQLQAVLSRKQGAVHQETVICSSSSNESVDNFVRAEEESSMEVLFKASSGSRLKRRSLAASDLSVEDLEEKDSNQLFYPVATSSARAFKQSNLSLRRSINSPRQATSSDSKGSGYVDVVPGTLVTAEEEHDIPVRKTRQITISSDEEDIAPPMECADSVVSDEVVPFEYSPRETQPDKRIMELTGIYVQAKTSYTQPKPGELRYMTGDLIKQEKTMNEDGKAYGYLRKTKYGPRIYGFYSVDNVKFYRCGSSVKSGATSAPKSRQTRSDSGRGFNVSDFIM